MFNEMQKWFGGLGPDDQKLTLQALTKVGSENIISMIAAEVVQS